VFGTVNVTLAGRGAQNMDRHRNSNWGHSTMVYEIDRSQLFGLSTVARLLGEIREISDVADRSALLTKAQIILTAFIVDLEPLPE
jgi:hypothetical protein